MKQRLQNLFQPDKMARTAWDNNLLWFRLRYREGEGVQKCLNWLSSTQQPGRVALHYEVAMLARLYVGLPPEYATIFSQMAADYGFKLTAERPPTPLTSEPLFPCETVNWQASFSAHLVQAHLFTTQPGGKRGSQFPQPPQRQAHSVSQGLCLPVPPPFGMTLQAVWQAQGELPAELWARRWPETTRRWPLGKTAEGVPLSSHKPLNLYGEPDRVADWLLSLVQQEVVVGQGNLVVIDGKGNLVTRLKRKASIVQRLNKEIGYFDLDNKNSSGGFNPLAVLPGESETAVLERWAVWLSSISGECTADMLVPAWEKGVRGVPQLRQWLSQPDQQQEPVFAPLRQAIETLCKTSRVREWLDWPKGCLTRLPEGFTLFSCRAMGVAEAHILNSVVLGAMEAGARIVLHGFPWQTFPDHPILAYSQVVLSNAPPLPESLSILVQSGPKQAEALARRFFPDSAESAVGTVVPTAVETLILLPPGECLLVTTQGVFGAAWGDEADLAVTPPDPSAQAVVKPARR